ncbi:hypothetical protein [Microviridae Fen4707_41]|nr:hypothetical protein [Microviridae Fen4707_41]AKI26911.1 hypothetical protein [Microviridae Fen4707_41]
MKKNCFVLVFSSSCSRQSFTIPGNSCKAVKIRCSRLRVRAFRPHPP